MIEIPHKHFCVLPWISLEASPIGTVRPCCLADHEVTNEDGIKFTLGETEIGTIRNSEYMRGLRQQFLDSKQPKTCRRCWAEEDAGRTSKRMHTLDRLKHIVTDGGWTEEAKPLMFLDLKLGNICNLKCRICGSWSSSSYAAEEIKYQKDKKNNFHYVMMRLGRWPREEQRFWQDLEQNMHQLRYLEFTGGEPFMIQEHFDLLDKLVAADLAGNIEIHYNTNGTIYPSAAEQVWQKFRHVEIAFSIDDIGKRFEYQRSGAEWLAVNTNISLFREMRQRNKNISLQVCTTVNVFNVMYLSDVAEWIDRQDFDFVYWNMLHDAPQFCIANLPDKAKDLIEINLNDAKFNVRHRVEIKKIIDFMRQKFGSDGSVLRKEILKIDQRRAEHFDKISPELAEAIDYESITI